MKKRLLMLLSAAMAGTLMLTGISLPTDVRAAQSAEFTSLGAISDVRQDGNEVYLRYEGGEQAKISVLNDSVLRFDMEPDGQFREHPAPRDESHTTTIVAKSQDEYEEEYQPSLTLSEGEDIIVETDEMQLIIDPETAMMKMVNKESGETVLEEREPLKYNDTETVQTLKSDASEYYFGGGQQNGYFSHKGRKVAVENKSTWVDGGVSSPNPFYFSSKGYGVVRHTFAQGEYDFRDEETIVLSHDEKRFDAFYFVEDSSKDILSDYVEYRRQGHQQHRRAAVEAAAIREERRHHPDDRGK